MSDRSAAQGHRRAQSHRREALDAAARVQRWLVFGLDENGDEVDGPWWPLYGVGPPIRSKTAEGAIKQVREWLPLQDCWVAFAAVPFDFRNVIRQRVGKTDLAAFDQDHDAGGSGNYLGETRQIEDRIGGHRFACRLDGARAVRFAPNNLAPARDQHYGAGQMTLLNFRLDQGIHLRQFFERNAGLGGFRSQQSAGVLRCQREARQCYCQHEQHSNEMRFWF